MTGTRSDQAVSLRVKQGDGTIRLVFWTDGDKVEAWAKTEKVDRPAPRRWGTPKLINRWDRPTTGISALSSTLQSNLPGAGDVTVEGIWLTEITKADHEKLDAGEARPTSLEQRISKTLDTEKTPDIPRTWYHDDLGETAAWIYNEILVAQHEKKDLSSLAEAAFVAVSTAPSAETTLSESEKSKGIELNNGRVFIPRPAAFAPGFTDVDWLRACYNARMPVSLMGPPGTGKTMLVEATFAGTELVIINGTPDLREHNLVGQFIPTAVAGEFVWHDGPLTRAMELGLPCLVDEFMRIDPQVMTLFYPLMDGRGQIEITSNPSRGIITAKEGFMPIFASNPDVPGAAMDEPLASRFTAMPTVLTDFDLAETLGVTKDIVTVARNMDVKRQNDEVQWSPQMRELINYRENAARFSPTYALSELLSRCERLSSTSDRVVLEELIARVTGKATFAPLVIGKSK